MEGTHDIRDQIDELAQAQRVNEMHQNEEMPRGTQLELLDLVKLQLKRVQASSELSS